MSVGPQSGTCTLLVPIILIWLIDFRKNCATLQMGDDNDYRVGGDGDDGNVKIVELSWLLEVLITMCNFRALTVRCL
jgi:hypothetical protein